VLGKEQLSFTVTRLVFTLFVILILGSLQ